MLNYFSYLSVYHPPYLRHCQPIHSPTVATGSELPSKNPVFSF